MKRFILLAALGAVFLLPEAAFAQRRGNNVNVAVGGGSAAVSVQQRGGLFGLRRNNVNVAVGGGAAVVQSGGFRRNNVNVAVGGGIGFVGTRSYAGVRTFGGYSGYSNFAFVNRGFVGYSNAAFVPNYSSSPTVVEETTVDTCGRVLNVQRYVLP